MHSFVGWLSRGNPSVERLRTVERRCPAVMDSGDLEIRSTGRGVEPDTEEIVAIWLTILIIAAAIAVVALLAWAIRSRKRSAALQRHFGSEYDRRIEEHGDRKAAEAELLDVSKRRRSIEVRPLSAGARDRYAEEWRQVQSHF